MAELKNSNDAVNFAKVISLNNKIMDTVSNLSWMHTTHEGETTLKHARGVAGFLFAIIIALFALTVSSCKKDDIVKPEPPVKTLAGTKWQLAKLMHTETKVERPIFIGNKVFTQFVPIMDFETDSTGMLETYTYSKNPLSYYHEIPFNINRINTTDSFAICWISSINLMMALDNIERFLGCMQCRLLGYKIEDTSLKLFCPDDGFFYYNGYTKEITYMYSQFGLCTDSNWYNCLVFEEVK